MFDHLEWWQVFLVLGPLVGIMQLIRYRELTRGQTPFSSLSKEQKVWVFLMLMPPGLCANLMLELSEEERLQLMEAGGKLRGTGRNLAEPVMREYLDKLPNALKKGDSGDLLERLATAVQTDPAAVLSILRTGLAPIEVRAATPVPAETAS